MTIRRRPQGPVVAPGLSDEDLMLCVFGPWHPDSHVGTERALHHPRCKTERLVQVWRQHEREICARVDRATRTERELYLTQSAGAPWCVARLEFVSLVRGEQLL